jgi:DNA-binding winged helix-turn-helix (wHTH) protein/TolB-like protein
LGEWIVFPRRHAVEPTDSQDQVNVHNKVNVGLGRKVSAKAMAVLLQLAHRPGQVVGKEELIDAVWPGAYTSDEALSTVIYELRRVLGDRASAPRYIETIRKSGYRLLPKPLPHDPIDVPSSDRTFVSLSTPEDGEETTSSPSIYRSHSRPRSLWTPLLAMILLAALVVAGFAWFNHSAGRKANESGPIDSLAVLPLSAYIGDDRQLLDSALTDMLIGDIAQVCAVDVAPGIALPQRSGSWSLEEALDALGVDAVVEGAVARSGENIWISLQLVDLRSGRMLWSATYDRKLGDELLVLREVTRDAALRIRDELALHPVWQELPDPISIQEPAFEFESLDPPKDQKSSTFSQDLPE